MCREIERGLTGGRGCGCGRRRFDFERALEPVDGEDDVVAQHVEVPRDHGTSIRHVNDSLVNLAF